MGKPVDALHYYSIVLIAKFFVPNYKCYYSLDTSIWLSSYPNLFELFVLFFLISSNC